MVPMPASAITHAYSFRYSTDAYNAARAVSFSILMYIFRISTSGGGCIIGADNKGAR